MYIGRIGAIYGRTVNEKERGYRKHGASRHRLKVYAEEGEGGGCRCQHVTSRTRISRALFPPMATTLFLLAWPTNSIEHTPLRFLLEWIGIDGKKKSSEVDAPHTSAGNKPFRSRSCPPARVQPHVVFRLVRWSRGKILFLKGKTRPFLSSKSGYLSKSLIERNRIFSRGKSLRRGVGKLF